MGCYCCKKSNTSILAQQYAKYAIKGVPIGIKERYTDKKLLGILKKLYCHSLTQSEEALIRQMKHSIILPDEWIRKHYNSGL